MAGTMNLHAIRTIVFRDWNPIGVEPDDAPGEYESYVPKIAAIAELKDARRLADHLDGLERNMGLDGIAGRNLRVAEQCVALFRDV